MMGEAATLLVPVSISVGVVVLDPYKVFERHLVLEDQGDFGVQLLHLSLQALVLSDERDDLLPHILGANLPLIVGVRIVEEVHVVLDGRNVDVNSGKKFVVHLAFSSSAPERLNRHDLIDIAVNIARSEV